MITQDDINGMKDTPELLPCPFCGGDNVINATYWIAHPVEYFGRYDCGDCDIQGPLSEYKYDNEDEASEDARCVWNTRAKLA